MPPAITRIHPKTSIDAMVKSFHGYFSSKRIRETGPASVSEDFGSFGAEWHSPSVFWFVGGTVPEAYAKATAIVGGLLCFVLRFMAIRYGWHLPVAKRVQHLRMQR